MNRRLDESCKDEELNRTLMNKKEKVVHKETDGPAKAIERDE